MKKIAIFLLVPLFFFSCSEQPKTLVFTTLKPTEFNTQPFQLPGGAPPDSLHHVHDSCMGFTFAANAMLIQSRDSLAIGNIMNRQSLTVVSTLSDLAISREKMMANVNVVSNPCYEKRMLHFPLKQMLGDTFALQLPGASAALNKEINDAISATSDAEMQTGSWVYLDMKDVIKNVLDTTQSTTALAYKKNLLNSANMVLTAVESITDVSFLIHTQKPMSAPLLAVLKTKPVAPNPTSQVSLTLSYIDDSKFEMTLNGFFPVVGQMMKAELK